MSIARLKENKKVSNPAKKIFEWDSVSGEFTYYSKELQQTIIEGDKLRFIVVDDRPAMLYGWNSDAKSAYYSNEFLSINDNITVKCFNDPDFLIGGKYAEIKEKVKALQIKYVKVLYVALFNEENVAELACIKLKGSTFKSFLDAKTKSGSLISTIKGETFKINKKSKDEYYSLNFLEAKSTDIELYNQADEIYDTVYKLYRNAYDSSMTNKTSQNGDANNNLNIVYDIEDKSYLAEESEVIVDESYGL